VVLLLRVPALLLQGQRLLVLLLLRVTPVPLVQQQVAQLQCQQVKRCSSLLLVLLLQALLLPVLLLVLVLHPSLLLLQVLLLLAACLAG
jgi:hypothetical protein